jgi:hypothetical protein
MKNEKEFVNKMLDRSILKEKKKILGEFFTQNEELYEKERQLENDIKDFAETCKELEDNYIVISENMAKVSKELK